MQPKALNPTLFEGKKNTGQMVPAVGSALVLVNSQDKIANIPEIVAYARVSSSEQAEHSAAFEQQKARLKAAGAELVIGDIAFGREEEAISNPPLSHHKSRRATESIAHVSVHASHFTPSSLLPH